MLALLVLLAASLRVVVAVVHRPVQPLNVPFEQRRLGIRLGAQRRPQKLLKEHSSTRQTQPTQM